MDASPDDDRERLMRLLAPMSAKLQATARRLSRSNADGDDIYQEALLTALSKLSQLRDESAFGAWMYRILVSTHRRQTRNGFWRRLSLVPAGVAETAPDPNDFTEAHAGAMRLRCALAKLPAVQREAIVLFELNDMTVDDVAAIQSVSASAVKSRLARARERLRRFYIADAAKESALLREGTTS